MKNLNILIISLILLIQILSCKKQNEWLDKKSNKGSVVPETLTDFQAVLDNTIVFNYNCYNTAGLVGSDDSYVLDVNFGNLSEPTRNLYTWKKQIWSDGQTIDWSGPFAVIELANIILEGLERSKSTGVIYDNIKGQALFHRAWAYYCLAQLFCKPYSSLSSNTDLGLPLRLNSDVNKVYQRSNLKNTYLQILSDALEASKLLPKQQPYNQRPISAAAFGLAAKTFLNMEDYKSARLYADLAINNHPDLLDFNNTNLISQSTTNRFPINGINNPEILFYCYAGGGGFTAVWLSTSTPSFVDPLLYQSYEDVDLRKSLYYVVAANGIKPRGSFSGKSQNFTGIAINEIYLIRSECSARDGDIISAMKDLNHLLIHRYKTNSFDDISAEDRGSAIQLVLKERRKELAFVSNIRWEDLRRLNKDSNYAKKLTRIVNGVTYNLDPNSPNYVLPIPDKEIQISNIAQNIRQ